MRIFKLTGLIAMLGSLLSAPLLAQDASDEEKLRQALLERMPDLVVDSISETVLPGIFELVSESQVYYLSPDGKFMLDGSIIDLENRVNISDQRRGELQLSLISEMPEDQMVVFNNESNDAERWITVFTDSDCGFCQKLHREIDDITDAGIRVRYLLFPRAGMESASFRELQSVWCSDDQQQAMTVAKSGGTVDSAVCSNPIQSHMELANRVGLRGTPLIYLDDGTKIPGYRPAAELVRMIESSEPLALK
jgi:thiol:disulfide interchange protein DsbC